ncbi:hypothetical protein JQK88_35015 [Mesorhizobium caraganae]|nr:hypothetical protein [Mesorhizobium caraganae]MBM2716275.1 hypothetical protein [Mesorhizobium caraganae]
MLAARQKIQAVTMGVLRKETDDIAIAVLQISSLRPSDVIALDAPLPR